MSEQADAPVTMPSFVRKALLAQGKYDPDAIEAAAQTVDLDAVERAEQLRLEEANLARRAKEAEQDATTPQARWYDDL